jgi:tetratricopeptide (TPR) repeat protein
VENIAARWQGGAWSAAPSEVDPMPRHLFARPFHPLAPAACGLALVLAFANATAKTVDEWVAEGDQHYAQARLPEAAKAYAAAIQAAPAHFVALCRAARAESELGELQKSDEQRLTRAAAVEHARAAIKAAPDSAAGHVWLAVALGRQALSEGPKTKLALSREIKSEVDRGLALDPNHGRAWHVVAMWNVKLASLNAFERMAANAVLGGVPKGASFDNAEIAFRKAIALEPGYVNHHLEYGRLLHELHRKADARRELELAIALPPTSDALDAHYQVEARTLLSRLGK